jgi:hypothetical protein
MTLALHCHFGKDATWGAQALQAVEEHQAGMFKELNVLVGL